MVVRNLRKRLQNILSNRELFLLFNIANIRSGLLTENFVSSTEDFLKFENKALGIPILIPADENILNFAKEDVFEIRTKQILETVYSLSDDTYVGFKHAFNKFKFLTHFEVKKAYQPYVEEIVQQNWNTIQYVDSLRNKFKDIGAFQTRNIPHFGHEKIMNRMLEHCDHLVINPVVGPKKRGDVTIKCLTNVFKYLTETKYKEKISFAPICANMFYAGPREAFHHTLMRQKIGFQHFTVGRDHAGAQKAYAPNMAAELIKQHKDKLEINVVLHKGAVFCDECDGTIILDECDHPFVSIKDISGTDFRASMVEKRLFPLADKKMQLHLFNSKIALFEL
jgi:sulfate adenylyltransferase